MVPLSEIKELCKKPYGRSVKISKIESSDKSINPLVEATMDLHSSFEVYSSCIPFRVVREFLSLPKSILSLIYESSLAQDLIIQSIESF